MYEYQHSEYNSLPEIVTTSQAAKALNRAEQTLRRWACQENGPNGIRPVRINRRLAWRVADLNCLLAGEMVGKVGGQTGLIAVDLSSQRVLVGGVSHALS
jgi:hypothetical protein